MIVVGPCEGLEAATKCGRAVCRRHTVAARLGQSPIAAQDINSSFTEHKSRFFTHSRQQVGLASMCLSDSTGVNWI